MKTDNFRRNLKKLYLKTQNKLLLMINHDYAVKL